MTFVIKLHLSCPANVPQRPFPAQDDRAILFTAKHCLPPFTHVDSWLEATVIAFSMRATQFPRAALGITHAKHLVPDLTQYPDAVWVPIEHYSYSGNVLLGATLSVILTIHMPVVCTHISTY